MYLKYLLSTVFLSGASYTNVACTNPPGALKLRLEPATPTFRSDETIRVAAVFFAEEGRICIPRPTVMGLNITLTNVNSDQSHTAMRFGQCGLNGLFLLPLYPALYVGAGLDIADITGRFVIITPQKPYSLQMEGFETFDGKFVVFADSENGFPHYERNPASLNPGRYRLSAEFKPEKSRVVPPPLFWRIYEEPVEATLEFDVIEDGGT